MSMKSHTDSPKRTRKPRPPVLLSRILDASPALVEHMAEHLGLGLTRGDHFRGLQLEDKLFKFLGRKEWVLQQLRQLSDDDRKAYREILRKLLTDLSTPSVPAALSERLLELGLAFMIENRRGVLVPLEFAFLSDAAWTTHGSLAQALVAYLAQGVIPRQAIRSSASTSRALQNVASIYLNLRQTWKNQIPGLSLRQLLAIETMKISGSSQPASRLASLLGAGSPEVFSWPRYMRYHGTGSHNPLQELLFLGLVRPKTLDPGAALKELIISLEAEKPVEKALPTLFRRYTKGIRKIKDTTLVPMPPPGSLGLDLQRFIIALGIIPPPATKDGTPSMIHVDRLARLLGIPQQYQRFLLSIAWDSGWLVRVDDDDTGRIEPAPEVQSLISAGPDALRKEAIQMLSSLPSWDETRASHCRLGNPGPMTHLVGRLRNFLLELSPNLNRWTPVSGLTSLLIGSNGFRRLLATAPDLAPVTEILNTPQETTSPLFEALAQTLWWAQLLDMSKDQAGNVYVRVPSQEAETEIEPLPSVEKPIPVAANGEFYLPLNSPLSTLKQAEEFADIHGVDRACRFRISRQSLARGVQKTWSLESIESFLASPLPQNIRHLAEEVFSGE